MPFIYTDHKLLMYTFSCKSPRLVRWAIRLIEFRTIIRYVNRENKEVADWLSRSVVDEEQLELEKTYVSEVYHIVYSSTVHYNFSGTKSMDISWKRDGRSSEPEDIDLG